MVNSTALLMYTFTLGIAALVPGPGMTALLFKTLTTHYKNGLIMLLGLITGDLCYLAIALFGLNAIAAQIDSRFSLIIICCACAYLYFIAIKLWLHTDDLLLNSNRQSSQNNQKTFFSNYLSGLLLTLSNPKTITFYLALVPTILGSSLSLNYSSLIVILMLTLSTLGLVGGLYIFSALKIKKLLGLKSNQRIFLKSLAIVMASLSSYLLFSHVHFSA